MTRGGGDQKLASAAGFCGAGDAVETLIAMAESEAEAEVRSLKQKSEAEGDAEDKRPKKEKVNRII
jgi:hypothetical protein